MSNPGPKDQDKDQDKEKQELSEKDLEKASGGLFTDTNLTPETLENVSSTEVLTSDVDSSTVNTSNMDNVVPE